MDDGIAHRIELVIVGKQIDMTIDDGKSQSVINDGVIDRVTLASKQNLYLGGLPDTIAIRAIGLFHIKQSKSLQGT